jgi:hypothetical protein
MAENRSSRSESIRRQGEIDCAFAVLTAMMLAAGDGASPAIVMAIGTAAVWMALRGRRRIALSGPLDVEERRELERLAGRSRQVRELTETLARSGQAPVRYDLERFRALARVESLLDSRT